MSDKWQAFVVLSPFIVFWGAVLVNAVRGIIKDNAAE